MNQDIRAFLESRRIAVVGVSRSDYKYGTRVYRTLKARGYDVVPVNPNMDTFDGVTSYPNLGAIPEPVEAAVIIIPPPKVSAILREAAELGIRHLWLQPGAESDEAVALADELGLNLVYDACVMVKAPFVQPV